MIPSLQVGYCCVGVQILLGYKNVDVFVIFKTVIFVSLCNSFDIVHY